MILDVNQVVFLCFIKLLLLLKLQWKIFREFVDDERIFTRSRKWDFKDFIIFESFHNGTTNRHEIRRYAKNFKDKHFKHVKRQNFCQRRVFINPEAWKSASREYLKQIHINTERVLFKTFKGFRLFAGDGSDFDLLEIEELRKKI